MKSLEIIDLPSKIRLGHGLMSGKTMDFTISGSEILK